MQTSSETSSPQARPIVTFGLGNRPNSLRLPSGTAFAYLLPTINKSTAQTGLQVACSYG